MYSYSTVETLSPFSFWVKCEVSSIILLLIVLWIIECLTRWPVSGEAKFHLGLFNGRPILKVLESNTYSKPQTFSMYNIYCSNALAFLPIQRVAWQMQESLLTPSILKMYKQVLSLSEEFRLVCFLKQPSLKGVYSKKKDTIENYKVAKLVLMRLLHKLCQLLTRRWLVLVLAMGELADSWVFMTFFWYERTE